MNPPPSSLSPAYGHLLEHLEKLPGIGRRSAERIAFHLLKAPPQEALALSSAIVRFTHDLKACSLCGHFTESDPCPICADERRDRATLLVVERPSDIVTLEQLGVYRGLYHVLMGRLSPLESVGLGDLNIRGLLERAQNGGIREVILCTQPTLEGDGTAAYLAEQLASLPIKVSRLARGIPVGASLQGVSKAVLMHAVQGRQGM